VTGKAWQSDGRATGRQGRPGKVTGGATWRLGRRWGGRGGDRARGEARKGGAK